MDERVAPIVECIEETLVLDCEGDKLLVNEVRDKLIMELLRISRQSKAHV